MTIYSGIVILLLVTTVGLASWTVASENTFEEEYEDEIKSLSEESDSSPDSRSDLSDLSDDVLRSFFDFTSTEENTEEDSYEPSEESSRKAISSGESQSRRLPYYSKHANSDKRPIDSSHRRQASQYARTVTPGSHFRPKPGTFKTMINEIDEKAISSNSSTGLSTVVGPYEISVVDANSPLLSSLGVKRHHLEKIYGSPLPQSKDLTVSDSVPTATYVAHPRHQQTAYNPSSYPKPPPPSHHHAGEEYAKADYAPSNAHHRHEYAPYPHPPPPPSGTSDYNSPQRNYSPTREYQSSSAQPQNARYKYPYPSAHPQAPHQAGRYQSEPWKPTGSSSTHQSKYGYNADDDEEVEKKDPNYNRGLWQHSGQAYPPHPPPLPYKSSSDNFYRKPSYNAPPSSSKPPLGTASYHKTEGSYSKPSYISSSEYSHGHSTSSSSKAPSRAGAASYDAYHSHHASAKPAISISFKAKKPSGGVTIPLNFNPLEVVKKLAMPLSALNPLNNKKVTIGITIENKNSHSDTHISHY